MNDLRTIVQARFNELPYVEGADNDIYPRSVDGALSRPRRAVRS
jgi:hypothetical protein